MNFNFTVITEPADTLGKELDMIKGMLLYADNIKVVSPLLSRYLFYSNLGSNHVVQSDQSIIHSVQQTELGLNLFSKQIDLGLIHIPDFKNRQREFIYPDSPVDSVAENEIATLLKCEQVNFVQFQFNNNYSLWLQEYIENLINTFEIASSFPVVDDGVSKIMKYADALLDIPYTNHCYALADTEKAKHAAITSKLIFSMPKVANMTICETLDVKKELDKPLVRFRSAIQKYSDEISSYPYDKNFDEECDKLFIKYVWPTLLELEELKTDSNMIKNLGKQIFNDTATYAFFASIFSSAALTNLMNIDFGKMLPIYGGTAIGFMGNKISKAMNEHSEAKKKIERNSLYFLYVLKNIK